MKILSWISSGIVMAYILGVQVFATEGPNIVINEVAWAGSFASSSDEWIELHNRTSEPVNLSGWQMTKNTGTESLMVTIPPDTLIEAGDYFVISNFDGANSVLAVEPNVVELDVSLSNTELLIKLYSGDFQDPSNLVDTAGDGGAPLAGSNATKASMERTTDLSGWQDATTQINLDDGAQELGTPGAANSTPTLPPTLTSVSPSVVEIGETLVVDEILGSNFEEGATLKLQKGGQSIMASGVHIASPTLIDAASFETSNATAGEWDLVLTNPDALEATLPAAITLQEPAPEYDLATTVRISEVYPAPESGQEEFIELFNFGDKAVNLMGWKVDDIPNGGSGPFVISNITILPSKFVVITKAQSHITLNDSGDSVSLIQPNGFEIDKKVFREAVKGSSWSWFENESKWTTTVTPNGINIFTQEEAEGDDTIPEEEDAVKSYKRGDVRINELLPNPDGDEEFIELQNMMSETVNLKGWYLKDASGKKYVIKEGTVAKAQQLVVVYADVSKISLNNSGGEEVSLFDPSDQLISSVKYPDKAPVDVAYALDTTDWFWTAQATPGRPNQIEINEIEEAEILADTEEDDSLPVTGTHKVIPGLVVLFGALGILSWRRYAISNQEK